MLQRAVIWGIFGTKRKGVRDGWIKLQNEEFQDLFSSKRIIVKSDPKHII
jgi:hypothetical protein